MTASNIVNAGTTRGGRGSHDDVVTACQRGDRDAFRRLYDVFAGRTLRVCARMVGAQDAADVVQAVFLQVFKKIGQFDQRSSFETWLYRLTVNESLQHLRRRQRWQFQTMEWEPMDTSPDGKSFEHRELLERALLLLDPELRAIFLLRETEELSYREIAVSLQIPEGTVGSRLNRARRELQHHLNQLGYEI